METKMKLNKRTAAGISLAVATAMVALLPAEASARGRHIGGGMRMMSMSGGNHNGPRRFHRHRPVYVANPTYTQETYAVRRAQPAPIAEPVALARYADGQGRIYDPVGRAWFDGKGNCWTGKQVWTFRDGGWFYGSYRWYQAAGMWRTDAAEAPVSIDCGSVAAFAGKVKSAEKSIDKSGEKKIARKEVAEEPADADQPNGRTAEADEDDVPAKANAVKPNECKKYFPSVAAMLPVPCK
jgi:hypothetical protein